MLPDILQHLPAATAFFARRPPWHHGDVGHLRQPEGIGLMFTSLDGRTHRMVRRCLASIEEAPTNPLARRVANG